MKTTEITDLAETTILTAKALFAASEKPALLAIAAELGDRLSHTATTSEDWDEDADGDPVCSTDTTVSLSLDGESIGTGHATGYYSRCNRGGEHFSSWQDGAGADHNAGWDLIAEILAAAGVIGSTYDLDESIDAPAEPAAPEEDEAGEYLVLYQGWEQPWKLKSRHASMEDATRAARDADRATTEANSRGAYGWDYAVACIDADGDEQVDGLTVTICEPSKE